MDFLFEISVVCIVMGRVRRLGSEEMVPNCSASAKNAVLGTIKTARFSYGRSSLVMKGPT